MSSAVSRGFSTIGKCPASSIAANRDPGIRRDASSAERQGNWTSCRPERTKVGAPIRSKSAETEASEFANTYNLPVVPIPTNVPMIRADKADLIYKTELAKFEKVFHSYSCVLGCLAAPNLSVLRNLNRVLVRSEKPLILGLIDGPFVSALSTIATETGCFECFEQRMLARLEDTLVYHQFVQATGGGLAGGGPWLSPQLHVLTALVISEGFLCSTLGMMRLAGRVVSIYLPLLEIQVQDVLRVPYCPACGFISKAQMNEIYTSSQRLVTEMMAKIEVEG